MTRSLINSHVFVCGNQKITHDRRSLNANDNSHRGLSKKRNRHWREKKTEHRTHTSTKYCPIKDNVCGYFNSVPLRRNPTQPTPVEFKHLMIGWRKLSEKRTAQQYRVLFLFSDDLCRMYEEHGASVDRGARLALWGHDLWAGFVFHWCIAMARFFSFVGAERAGWHRGIDRRRLGCHYIFYGYFLALHCASVTCYRDHAQPARLIRAERRTTAINPDSGRRLFEFLFLRSVFFNLSWLVRLRFLCVVSVFIVNKGSGIYCIWYIIVTQQWVRQLYAKLGHIHRICLYRSSSTKRYYDFLYIARYI